ncbi:hypothetical protein [Nonomuraea dietziae]|uniref:hypothetical protein n=1 Tax=Nonomuraea dietziae TaxID=65515 RepID=UPI0033CCA02F
MTLWAVGELANDSLLLLQRGDPARLIFHPPVVDDVWRAVSVRQVVCAAALVVSLVCHAGRLDSGE